jgi:predicted aspartyl protease
MTPLSLTREGLPFACLCLRHGEQELLLERALIDTGSAGTVISVEYALVLGLECRVDDRLYRMSGVGGSEIVYGKCIDYLSIGDLALQNFPLQIGAMDYNIALDAIIGMDFLSQVNARIDLAHLCIDSAAAPGL